MNASIRNVPVLNGAIAAARVLILGVNMTGLTGLMGEIIAASGTSIIRYQTSSTGSPSITDAVFTDTSDISFSALYLA